jgi:ABC-type transporter Mla subunit MlaD
MKAMQSTMVYLTQEQKTGLARRAQQRKTKVAAEIRSAVDAYLAGIGPQDLELLDAATRRAKQEIDAMLDTANAILASHAAFLRQMRRLRKEVSR